jgi:hypothetical protein
MTNGATAAIPPHAAPFGHGWPCRQAAGSRTTTGISRSVFCWYSS